MIKKRWIIVLLVLVVCILTVYFYKVTHIGTKYFGNVELIQIDFSNSSIDNDNEGHIIYERKIPVDDISEEKIVNYFISQRKKNGSSGDIKLNKEELLNRLTTGKQLYATYTTTDVMVKNMYALNIIIEKKSDFYVYSITEHKVN